MKKIVPVRYRVIINHAYPVSEMGPNTELNYIRGRFGSNMVTGKNFSLSYRGSVGLFQM